MLTEHNCGWTFYALYNELREEHEKMNAMEAPGPAASAGDPEEASAGQDGAAVTEGQDGAAASADQAAPARPAE